MSMLRHADKGYCGECQRLLDASEIARKVWNQQRAETCRSRLVEKETGDELLRMAGEVRESVHRIAETCAELPAL